MSASGQVAPGQLDWDNMAGSTRPWLGQLGLILLETAFLKLFTVFAHTTVFKVAPGGKPQRQAYLLQGLIQISDNLKLFQLIFIPRSFLLYTVFCFPVLLPSAQLV